ncbi:PLP-dependent aminotransferase family protein [Iamia sp. SCSIO 61187]|uniref:MocR-like pyridoxine biosynthesis transcription factor PdxR n=1 Tax=Iamia sp. SCSIO 61187 TaxID=2722752 RepID=UPI001C6265FD|nr:PLP-dependent aminotransferase family protein [Iamia sp. SCSIO 61187]QYG91264.1 PLP-dependent aminotransferase family protein [Iamia sp. SCSIO 61187]
MAVQWTGLGPELLVRLDRTVGEPLGAQLQRELREAIRAGRLAADERLPSSRVLAAELGVSRGLVVDTYAQLEAEGYLVTRVGSGTRVAADVAEEPGPSAHSASRRRAPRPAPPPAPRLDVDFEYGLPDLASFPMRDWLWALTEAGRTTSIAGLGDEVEGGAPELRRVLASYLGRVRGSCAEPADVVVTAGFRQGLNIVLRALAGSGITHVALEDPGPREDPTIVERCGQVAVAVPVDERGLDVDALAATRARAVVVTPAHQCPTGVVLAPERRHALVAWAERVDGVVIEDDYDAEFRYDRQPVGSLQGLAPDRVVAMGSVSKTLAPALRLGWMLVPPALMGAVLREKQLVGRGAPGLDQVALARLIESGRFDKHLRRMRGVYDRRRSALVEALAEHVPGVALRGLAAGCHAVVPLPAGADEAAVVAEARRRGVGVYDLGRYRVEPAPAADPALVLGFGDVDERAIRRGIAAIADLLRP